MILGSCAWTWPTCVAADVCEDDDLDGPSWAIDSRMGVAYLKPSSEDMLVLAVNLSTATVTRLEIPMTGEFQDGENSYLGGCTGDSRLLLYTLGTSLGLWSPGTPEELPVLIDVFTLAQSPADISDGTAGNVPATLRRVWEAAIDRHGNVLVFDYASSGNQTYGVCVIRAGLVPPAHLAPPPPPPAPTDPAWGVGTPACTASLCADMAAALQGAGHSGDVALVAAGGEVVRAHSAVLAARSEWFAAALGRWQGDASGSSSAAAPISIDLKWPAPVVRALLRYLYCGQVQLAPEPTGAAAEAAAGAAGLSSQAAQEQQQGGKAGAGSGSHDPPPPHLVLAQLLEAAQYFGLPQLGAACMAAVRAHMGPGNALPWLVYGHEGGGEALARLKRAALDYVAQHCSDIKRTHPETLQLLSEHGSLAMELMEAREEVLTGPAAKKQRQ